MEENVSKTRTKVYNKTKRNISRSEKGELVSEPQQVSRV